ncbi:AMP nucleosidase [Corynebacterium sp. 13CS0277]|uniref:AMP nucleosidase n=1 Tax=Corynebacterium sp. 13CS0277 TaxID=2071994 RepID=UPI000D026F4B|nr:AMP nucleosidase [Corynebacterium sp. 13CS0277]PRQ10448.1 AMP nucleosidase [Corynebacterium sp. 13CS0277]
MSQHEHPRPAPRPWRTDLTIAEAVDYLIDIYDHSCATARELLSRPQDAAPQDAAGADSDACAVAGGVTGYEEVVYPKLVVEVTDWVPAPRTEPFGYVDHAGTYSAVLSRPGLMRRYLTEQLERLCGNYPCVLSAGPSHVQIPPEYIDDLPALPERTAGLPRPSLDDVDDAIIDAEWDAFHGAEAPLVQFSPQRFDIACKRIEHYTGVSVDTVQRYILFTNYPMHMEEFEAFGRDRVADPDSRYTDFRAAASTVQMPRYDLIAPDNTGVTMINIGVGPSNAKTITDCLAVLRPECWIMIGHCAGLDGRMRIGDLILGNAYQRRDHILDERIGWNVPIPAIPEVQRALEKAVVKVYGKDNELMRTGTVMSTDDRNWEWHTDKNLWEMLRGSTAVAVDMESAALATNGYRYRVPYGTLLSVSDLPLHNVPKLPSGAQAFYASSKQAHVLCALRAVEALAAKPHKLHTRKLRRTIGEVPFR